MTSQHNIKVGLIGLGNMGLNHLRIINLLKGFKLIFVADTNAEVATKIGVANGVQGVVDPKKLLPDVDAVIICTPTSTHAEYINMCLDSVQNIFVEKPMTDNLKISQELANFSKNKSLNVQVGYIERFNPAVRSLQAIIDRSDKLVSLDFTRTNKLSSRITDVDVVTDLMIHDIDMALHINGPAGTVSAHGFLENGMISFASALITHEGGRFSRIQASRITNKKIRKIEGTCLDMYIDCDLLRKDIVINQQSVTRSDNYGYTISSMHKMVEVDHTEALLSELQAFAANCREPGSVRVPGPKDDVAAMRVCMQIKTQINHSNTELI